MSAMGNEFEGFIRHMLRYRLKSTWVSIQALGIYTRRNLCHDKAHQADGMPAHGTTSNWACFSEQDSASFESSNIHLDSDTDWPI